MLQIRTRSSAIARLLCFLPEARKSGHPRPTAEPGNGSVEEPEEETKMRLSRIEKILGQAGFSLLEMLFATVILLVGLVAVAQLVPASILLNWQNRYNSASTVFAQRELDQ